MKGASGKPDRAGALRAEPAAQSQAKPLIPSAGHTPGPWHVFASGWAKERGQVEINAEDGLTVAFAVTFLPSYRAASEANARLIAAAPELLDVLRTVHDYAADVADGSMICPDYSGDLRKMAAEDLARIKAAIAKATGDA